MVVARGKSRDNINDIFPVFVTQPVSTGGRPQVVDTGVKSRYEKLLPISKLGLIRRSMSKVDTQAPSLRCSC